jgi:hypothetical protein
MEAEGWLSARKAATATGRHIVTIHKQAKAGRIIAMRNGNRLYVSVVSLLELYDDNPLMQQRIRAMGVVPREISYEQ